ncbi:hypothetical protein HYALB_00013962 [Hymenoscyphus albidus]|uniref:Uncharacterized protein n=1 Tax=Hymenoscyphus albidus TaxID=595503 RepID=A0A9N9LY53_9HELO|nr:hypothetical protein HYALB_00013962 [Hymenoscyphus albidus]
MQAELPELDYLASLSLLLDREFAHKYLQRHIENPPNVRMEPWIRTLSDVQVQNFGFLIYRLSYSETDEEWASKNERIIQEVEKVLEEIVGGECAVLRWIDGRKVEVEEGDLEGARKHFNSATIPESPNHIPRGLTTRTAIAVTPASLKSFDYDFCPFIHAIDPQYEPEKGPSQPSSAAEGRRTEPRHVYTQGYKESILLPLHIIYTDPYALRSGSSQVPMVNMEEMWAIATKHPWGLYTAPTTGETRREWRQMKELAGFTIKYAKDSISGNISSNS